MTDLTEQAKEELADWISPGNERAWSAVEAIVARHVADRDHLIAERWAATSTQNAAILRAEKAEAALARVRALADKWEAMHDTIEPLLGEPPQGEVRAFANELRAALVQDPGLAEHKQ